MWNILIYDSDTEERETLAMTILSFCKEGSLMNHVITDGRFLRCHSGYVVNVTQARGLLERKFVFENGAAIPISRTYYAEVRQAYLKHLSERTAINASMSNLE